MRSLRPWILWSDCLRVHREALSWRMNLRFRVRSDPEVQCFAKNRWFDPGKPSLCQALITVDKLYFAFLTFNHHSWLPWNSIKLILENAKNRHAGEDGRGWLSGWVRTILLIQILKRTIQFFLHNHSVRRKGNQHRQRRYKHAIEMTVGKIQTWRQTTHLSSAFESLRIY